MLARAALRRELRLFATSSSSSSPTRLFSSTAAAQADFSHVVIGGGVIGLAIARALSTREGNPATLLVERHGQVGTETSSRNSEVIHAGLYYGAGSLKTQLCVRGRDALYKFCAARGVGHRRTGKWIVAQDAEELAALERIAAHCASLSVESHSEGGERRELRAPVRFLTKEEARRLEPDVRADAGVLDSPETGIVDSHGLMLALQGLFEDAGGVTALSSEVVGIEPLPSSSSVPGSGGWRLTVRDTTEPEGETSTIEAETIINSAGLGAGDVHNMIAAHDPNATTEQEREQRRVQLHYAKGSYFSYGASTPRVGRLIYPAPSPGHAGLGTHLTLDLAGRARFGPDAEWIPWATAENALRVSAERLPQALTEIRRYLPGVDGEALAPDYAGIRPKLGRLSGTMGIAKGKGATPFQDFYIKREEGFEGWVNLLGMESPGLTSCLAIADYVRDLLYASRSPRP